MWRMVSIEGNKGRLEPVSFLYLVRMTEYMGKGIVSW
jgi:hypothetical protein